MRNAFGLLEVRGEVTCLVGACKREMWSTLCIPCIRFKMPMYPYTEYQKTYMGHPHLAVDPILEAFLTEEIGTDRSRVHSSTWEEGRGQMGSHYCCSLVNPYDAT